MDQRLNPQNQKYGNIRPFKNIWCLLLETRIIKFPGEIEMSHSIGSEMHCKRIHTFQRFAQINVTVYQNDKGI